MATGLHELKDDLTCAICQQVFCDPVALNCQHNYCRQCIHSLVNTEAGTAARCPECRVPVRLGTGGVAELPTNFKLAAIVRKVQERTSHDESGMNTCDEHGHTYELYCVTCQKILCKKCLPQHYKHGLNEINEELASRKEPLHEYVKQLTKMNTKLQACAADCQELDTNMKRTQDQKMDGIKDTYGKALQDLSIWRKNAEESVIKGHKEWHRTCDNTMTKLQCLLKEADKIIETSGEFLSGKKAVSLKGMDQLWKRINTFVPEVEKSIAIHVEKTMELRDFVDVDCAPTTHVVVQEVSTEQELKQQTTPKALMLLEDAREQRHTQEISLPKGDVTIVKTLTELQSDEVISSHIKFNCVSESCLQILEEGVLLKCNYMTPYHNYESWTNGRFERGRLRWTVDITIQPFPGHECECVCAVGVVHGASSLRDSPGKTSWYIGMDYKNGAIKYYCHGYLSKLMPPYNNWTSNRGFVSLKFYLNCHEKVLEVINGITNSVICKVQNVDISKPLIPAIRFYSKYSVPAYMSARLSTVVIGS